MYGSSYICSNPIFFFNDTATTDIYTLSLHDALPISTATVVLSPGITISTPSGSVATPVTSVVRKWRRSEEHTSELQSRLHLVCRLLLEKKKRRHALTMCCQPYIYCSLSDLRMILR